MSDQNPDFDFDEDVVYRTVDYILAALIAAGVALLGQALYNGFLGPLAKFPGPKLCAISYMPYFYHKYDGDLLPWLAELHKKYGETVRYRPEGISYTNADAWKDIYGHRKPSNPKDPRVHSLAPNGAEDILNARSDETHSAQRKIFTNAFSERSLKLQEPLLQIYVNKLITLIGDISKSGKELDIVSLYNYTTFDGDLTFGESMGMLDNNEYSPWVKTIFDSIKGPVQMQILKHIVPFFDTILPWIVPKHLREGEHRHFQASVERVNKRLATERTEADIWTLVMGRGKGSISAAESHANASLFLIAGTETTATLLSGLTYQLLTNPRAFKKIVEEVRTLETEDELNLENVSKMQYLAACIEEGLRVYPPVAQGFPRLTSAQGCEIAGKFVPPNTSVTIPQYLINRNPSNFRSPNTFIPERWYFAGTQYYDPQFDSDKKHAMQPFSTGPRNCLGKNLAYHEMRLILAKVLWHYDLELSEKSRGWADGQKAWLFWDKPELLVRAKKVVR